MEFARSVSVSVALRYWNSRWSDVENRRHYGRDASPEGLGANLRLTAAAHGARDGDLAPSLEGLHRLCDHRCFFTDFPEFAHQASTLERVALFLGRHMFAEAPPAPFERWSFLRVTDGHRLSFLVRPGLPTDLWVEERIFNFTCLTRNGVDPTTGLARPRGKLEAVARAMAPSLAAPVEGADALWAKEVFGRFAQELSGLVELTVDLGRHGALRVRRT